jgi:hypothetical protein
LPITLFRDFLLSCNVVTVFTEQTVLSHFNHSTIPYYACYLPVHCCISTMSRWRRVPLYLHNVSLTPCALPALFFVTKKAQKFWTSFLRIVFRSPLLRPFGHIFSFSLRIHTVADLQIKFHLHINTAVPSVTIVGFSQGKRQDQRAGELNDSLHFAMDKRTNCRGSWRSNHKRKTAYTSRLVSRKYLKLRSWWRE